MPPTGGSRSVRPGIGLPSGGPASTPKPKRLLLTHAFEDLDAIAVEFRTHFFNHASRRAIERLGAKLDGVLRNHRLGPEGTIRDTCSYSIIASEWPTVKVHLAHLQRDATLGGDAEEAVEVAVRDVGVVDRRDRDLLLNLQRVQLTRERGFVGVADIGGRRGQVDRVDVVVVERVFQRRASARRAAPGRLRGRRSRC